MNSENHIRPCII